MKQETNTNIKTFTVGGGFSRLLLAIVILHTFNTLFCEFRAQQIYCSMTDNIFDRDKIMELTKTYGEAAYYNNDDRVVGINTMFFANLLFLIFHPVWDMIEQKFYLYTPENGCWKKQDKKMIKYLFKRMIFHYGKEFNIPDIERFCSAGTMNEILADISARSMAEHENFFDSNNMTAIYCKNGMLVYDKELDDWVLKPFSPVYHQRNYRDITYNPNATCPRFLNELILSAMNREDAELLQLYLGQCLLGRNFSQTFLILAGTAGGGKSTQLSIFEAIFGNCNCTELRLKHADSRFELQRFIGKTLLTAKDVKSSFLDVDSAYKLKALVGNDILHVEKKGSNEDIEIRGCFNVIITANGHLQVSLDGDLEAWRRRLLIIWYENPPPEIPIIDFDKILLKEELSGIFNWILEGAIKLIKLGGKIPKSETQKKRIDDLLLESDQVNTFLRECLKPQEGAEVTVNELSYAFIQYCKSRGWHPIAQRKFQCQLEDLMLKIYYAAKRTDRRRNGKSGRWYSGVQLVLPKEDAKRNEIIKKRIKRM
jgi:P4 family phage/plasmid primase-like protien